MKIELICRKLISLMYTAILRIYKHDKISMGNNVIIDMGTRICLCERTKLIIGNNVKLNSNKRSYHASMFGRTVLMCDIEGATIRLGDNSRLNGVFVHAQKDISIGSNCVIAANVNIIDSNGHQLSSLDRTTGRDEPESIVIGNNVWIGLNVIILKGTIIGDNSVIGAGSVVKDIIPNNSLAVGNPAQVVKQFSIVSNKIK